MNDTLALIKGTTAESLDNVTSTFDDLPKPVYRGTTPKSMSRIVDATAAERSAAAKATNRGPARRRPPVRVTEAPQSTPVDASGDNPFPASAGQLDHITRTLGWLAEVDPEGAADMTAWLDRGNRAKLTGGRGGTASDLITRIKNRIEVKRTEARQVAAPIGQADDAKFQDVPNGYYAVADAGPDDIHYFRISRFRDGGIKVQERASDTLHPVRRGGRRTAILTTIQTMGWRESMELYGRTIGSCGRCGRTLTDAESRARGIGPDCWGKM